MSARERVRKLTPSLLSWYKRERRELPWRENPQPYYVWISEIMLQQTRVEAATPYFERFIKALPDVAALAAVKDEVLLKLWEGLGYYNRAKNLKKTAQLVVEQYGGIFPTDYETLLSFPGIGSYTAGAIASIAYGIPVPAVDGNVLRVLARLNEDGRDIAKQSVKREAEELLKETMPKEEAAVFNQALMEIGETVCLPNGAPLCERCPLAPFCLAHAHGTELGYPVKKAKKARRVEERTVLLLHSGMKLALGKREDKGLLAGMYEFPNFPGKLSEKEVEICLLERGLVIRRMERLADAKHIFSHVEWHMSGYEAYVDEAGDAPEGLLFVELEKLFSEYPVPSAFAAYKKHLASSLQKTDFGIH